MFLESLHLRCQSTSVIVVDPLADFLEEERCFATCYGLADTAPLRKVVHELSQLAHRVHQLRQARQVHAWNNQVSLILCRSRYLHNQFAVRGLETLCVHEAGRTSHIEECLFTGTITKIDNSIFTSTEFAKELLPSMTTFILTGITSTSCIAKSVMDAEKHMTPEQRIIIPLDAIASRSSQKSRELALIEMWKQSTQVIVVPSWKSLFFEV